MDFFYDGGTQVRTTQQRTKENIQAIVGELSTHNNADFIMLQEVDINAKRSYGINNLEEIKSVLPNFEAYYAPNYRVKYVPIPVTEPMGRVEAGLVTLTKYKPKSVTRYAFEGNFSWPKKLFMLDRCFMVTCIGLSNNKDLLIINTHNSAFDDGSLKAKQLEQISNFVTQEYKKGNYIVLGGDWNQNPPNYSDNTFGEFDDSKATFKISSINTGFLPSWNIFYDEATASNRYLTEPYTKQKTKVTILDFFLCSPNIKNISIETIDLGFENSDHNPVKFAFELN